MPAATTASAAPLTADQVKAFEERGYHILPAFLPPALCETLKREVDQFVADQKDVDPYKPWPMRLSKMQLEYHEHGFLLTEPRLMAMLRQLMGGEFVFHHLHTARHVAGDKGVNWHHDYIQTPQANRSHLMVHVFFYLNGLDGTIGDLLLVPGTQHRVMNGDAYRVFGHADLPGQVAIDDVPPGTAIIVHSAVQHARRPKPGGETRPRYFIDSSYCHAGVRWSSYRPLEYTLKMHARAKELGLGRGGEFDFVFDASRFFDEASMWEKLKGMNQGSLAERL